MSASTGHLRPASAGEARKRALALALPVLGMLALIATLPMGGAAIAAGSAVFAGACIAGLLLAPRPQRLATAGAAMAVPVQRAVDRALDVAEAPARVASLVAFVAIVWFIPIRVYTLPAPGPVKLEVGSSRVDLQACKLEYSIVSPK